MGDYNTANYQELGGDRWVVGGSLDIVSGGDLDIESGGKIKIAGVDKTAALAAAVATPVAGVAASYKIARGVATVTGTFAVATGLSTVVLGQVTLGQDPHTVSGMWVSCTTSATVGNLDIKVTKPTAVNDVTPVDSATGVKVNWIAVGT